MSYQAAKITMVANAAIPSRRFVQGTTVAGVRRAIEATDGTIVGAQDLFGLAEEGADAADAAAGVVVEGLGTGLAGVGGIALGVRLLTVDTAGGTGRLVAAVAGDQIVAHNLALRAVAVDEEVPILVVPGNF